MVFIIITRGNLSNKPMNSSIPTDIININEQYPEQCPKYLPLNQKHLIETAGQILSKQGELRDALLFATNNEEIIKKEVEYIDEQIEMVLSSKIRIPKKGNKSTFFREITHRKKIVQVSIQVYRNTTFNKNNEIVTDKLEWCVVGEHLQEIFRFLPKVKQPSGLFTLPTRGSKHSRWYPLDTHNVENLRRISLELRLLQLYISISEQRVERRVMQETSSKNSSEILSGVLDLDIKVDYSILDVFQKQTGIDLKCFTEQFVRNRGNPYRQSRGIYNYNKNGTSTEVLDAIFRIGFTIPNIYPNHISLDSKLSDRDEFQSHIRALSESKSNYCMALMSINKHSMFWVKHNESNMWLLCDPWKKKFLPGLRHDTFCQQIFNEIIGKNNWHFHPRPYEEQLSSEGSCAIASLSRVLQIAVILHFIDKSSSFVTLDEMINFLIIPIEDWSAMLASSLVRLGMYHVKLNQILIKIDNGS